MDKKRISGILITSAIVVLALILTAVIVNGFEKPQNITEKQNITINLIKQEVAVNVTENTNYYSSGLCGIAEALNEYEKRENITGEMLDEYEDGTNIREICRDNKEDVLKIEKIMQENNHAYIYNLYDCSNFSSDLVERLRQEGYDSYSAYCVFGRVNDVKYDNGTFFYSKEDSVLHTWVLVTIANKYVLPVDASDKRIILPEDYKKFEIIDRGSCK